MQNAYVYPENDYNGYMTCVARYLREVANDCRQCEATAWMGDGSIESVSAFIDHLNVNPQNTASYEDNAKLVRFKLDDLAQWCDNLAAEFDAFSMGGQLTCDTFAYNLPDDQVASQLSMDYLNNLFEGSTPYDSLPDNYNY